MEKDFMKRIVVNPKVMVGKPVIKGTRVTINAILGRLAEGWALEEIVEDLEITKEDIRAALKYAEKLAEGEQIFPMIVRKHEISSKHKSR